jgi:cytochrome P450
MSQFCPVFPKPKKTRASLLTLFFGKRRSWLDGLYERSYHMKMGEIHLPKLDLYMINEPNLVRQVMVEEADNFPKSAILRDALNPLLGDSIFTTHGSLWKRQRNMMDQSFEQMRLKLVFPLMQSAALEMQKRIDSLSDGASYDVELEMKHVTGEIMFRTIFSTEMTSEDAYSIFDAFSRFQTLVPKVMTPTFFQLPRWLLPLFGRRQHRQAALEIRAVLERCIRPRYDAFQSGKANQNEDILATMLAAKDPETGQGFSFDELINQVATLFLAGHETSASSLAWSLYLIANSPDIQERMVEEVNAASGSEDISYSTIREMELTRNVFREALRLYPPVGFFARQTSKIEYMLDKILPAQASIVISPWLIHRHRDLWQNPDAFDPDRFKTESAKESLKCAYLPFGMGPRVCMGAAFALQEGVLILATLVRRYRFVALKEHIPKPVGRLTIRSHNGIKIAIHKR